MQEKPIPKIIIDEIPKVQKKIPKTGPENKKNEHNLFNFSIKPEELEAYLNQYVIDQEEAISVIATRVCTHFNRMRFEEENPEYKSKIKGNIKSNILLLGLTGVGKTYIIKLIADKLGVPFVKGDATKFSETGYVGGDVEDLVRELVSEANGNIELAEHGIIYIDEIDKIAKPQGYIGLDVSRSGVQRNLLKLMEESDVNLKPPHDLAAQMEVVVEIQRTGKAPKKVINTKNILFIVSGAFDGLEKIILKRMQKNTIGFSHDDLSIMDEEKKFEVLKNVEVEDLMKYGFESEFIGRLPVIVTLNQLTEESLYKILKNPNNTVINSKIIDFLSYGINLEFTDPALRRIAKEAYLQKTGARGLLRIVEKYLIPFEKKLPSFSPEKFILDIESMDNPEKVINDLKVKTLIENYTRYFKKENDIDLIFNENAINEIASWNESYEQCFEKLYNKFYNYPHGIRLLNTTKFEITREILLNPEEELANIIKEYEKRINNT